MREAAIQSGRGGSELGSYGEAVPARSLRKRLTSLFVRLGVCRSSASPTGEPALASSGTSALQCGLCRRSAAYPRTAGPWSAAHHGRPLIRSCRRGRRRRRRPFPMVFSCSSYSGRYIIYIKQWPVMKSDVEIRSKEAESPAKDAELVQGTQKFGPQSPVGRKAKGADRSASWTVWCRG